MSRDTDWHVFDKACDMGLLTACVNEGALLNVGQGGPRDRTRAESLFQRACDVVIQKSLREGFGLVVSEALWKEKPVVAGRAGGIPMQVPPEFDRYLVDSVEDCAERIVHLLAHAGERAAFGRAGREHVRRRFLLPRLVRDELALVSQLL